MNIVIYGSGNQDTYLKKLNVPERCGGEPPYGGPAMAIEFAKAGHDVILVENNKKMMSKEIWGKVIDAGVRVVSDNSNINAVKNAEMVLFYKSFKNEADIKHTLKNITPHIPNNAVVADAYNFSANMDLLLKSNLKTERPDIGISSMYPTAIPGTPHHDSYIIAGDSTDGRDYASKEQIQNCIKLSKSAGKKPILLPANIAYIVSGMNEYFTIVSFAGILDIYSDNRSNQMEILKNDVLTTFKIFRKALEKCDGCKYIDPCLILEMMHNDLKNKIYSSQLPSYNESVRLALILLAGAINSDKICDNLDIPYDMRKNNIISIIKEMEYLISNYSLEEVLEYMHPEILIKSAQYITKLNKNIISDNDIIYPAINNLEKYNCKNIN